MTSNKQRACSSRKGQVLYFFLNFHFEPFAFSVLHLPSPYVGCILDIESYIGQDLCLAKLDRFVGVTTC